jgi:saccharopine dehydrogenase-like NADP-dependent oxidoreductase
MEELHEQVKQKGLTFLNELGLDPGIDHMTTMKTLNEVEEQKGKVIEY